MSASPSAEIAVIVVNYGTAELAVAAVESVLERDHGGRSVEVHLVDNASPEGDAERLAAAHAERDWGPRVSLHVEAENHGFGRGNNLILHRLAARAAAPDKVFLLNPDARLDNEAIAVLADFLDARPRVGFAGARISRPGKVPVSAAFRFHSLPSEIEKTISFGPVSRTLRRHIVALPPDQGTAPVDWVSGAAVMFRFAAISEVGFFDPDYFLYYEEADLMRRMTCAGWQGWHVAEAQVIHAEGAATQVRSHDERRRRPDYWYDSRRMYFEKNHGRPYALATAGLVAASGLAHLGIAMLRRRPPGLPLDFLSDYRRRVIWPLVTGRNPDADADADA
jgi:GT2 family glycosyltransferase